MSRSLNALRLRCTKHAPSLLVLEITVLPATSVFMILLILMAEDTKQLSKNTHEIIFALRERGL